MINKANNGNNLA